MESILNYVAALESTYQLALGRDFAPSGPPRPTAPQVAALQLAYVSSPLQAALSQTELLADAELSLAIASARARGWEHPIERVAVEQRDFDGSFIPTSVIGAGPNVRALRTVSFVTGKRACDALPGLFDVRLIRDYRELLARIDRVRSEASPAESGFDGQHTASLTRDFHVPVEYRVFGSPRFWSGVYPRYEDLIWGSIIALVTGVLVAEYEIFRLRQKERELRDLEDRVRLLEEGIRSQSAETLEVIEELTFEASARSHFFSKDGRPDDGSQRAYYDVVARSRATRGEDRPSELHDAIVSARAIRRVLRSVTRRVPPKQE